MRTTASAEGRRRNETRRNIKKSLFYDVVHLTSLVIHFEKRKHSLPREKRPKIYCERMIRYLGDESGMSNAKRFNCFVSLCFFNVAFNFLLKHWRTLRQLRRRSESRHKSRPKHVSAGSRKITFPPFQNDFGKPNFYCLWSRTGFNDHVGINDIIKVLKHAIWFINLPDYY